MTFFIPPPGDLGTTNPNLPQMGGALVGWLQPMQFMKVTKTVKGFQVSETGTVIDFNGVIQPLSHRDLMLKPEGQRSWTWLWLHADPSLALNVDEVVIYDGVATRVMASKDYRKYGYIDYHLVQDWTGAGPTVVTPPVVGGAP